MSDIDWTPELPMFDENYVSADDSWLLASVSDSVDDVVLPQPQDDSWGWHDARLMGVERETDDGTRYEIGAMDVYTHLDTGDLAGSYLPIASFPDVDVAAAFYHNLQGQIHDQGLPVYDVPKFAQEQAFAMHPEPENWRSATPQEYAAYEQLRDMDDSSIAGRDEPLVLETEVSTLQMSADSTFQALNAIGVEAENFNPTNDPPPFYDAQTGTAYWIGVFQPDRDDHEHCVTSILSLGRNPESGEMQAQLAPCVPGDWDKAYASAEYLIQVAQKGSIEQVFDAAEGMALATDQRDFWNTDRGVALDADAAQEIADTTREQWEVGL